MKSYELITVPAQPEQLETRVTEVLCDRCGVTIRQLLESGTSLLSAELRQRCGDAFEVTVCLTAGENNLDGGVGETTSFDLCPRCFEERLKPWLEEQGATAQSSTWRS